MAPICRSEVPRQLARLRRSNEQAVLQRDTRILRDRIATLRVEGACGHGVRMQRQFVQVPLSFQEFGRWQREGEAGTRWLAVLPDLVADQCALWDLQVDGEPRHGDNSLAVPVLRDGEPLVLKVSWPDHHVEEQALGLQLWNGQGTVKLVDVDLAAGALLLERLRDHRRLRDLPLREAVPLIGTLLRRLAIPAPNGYETTADVAAELHESLRHRWEATSRPFTPQVLDAALGLAEDLSSAAPTVMVDSDLHYEQILGGQREPWLVIDRLILVGDIEYQCGQLLWTRFDEIGDGVRLRWWTRRVSIRPEPRHGPYFVPSTMASGVWRPASRRIHCTVSTSLRCCSDGSL